MMLLVNVPICEKVTIMLINLLWNVRKNADCSFNCDQNNSYEITINGYQARKINKIRNVILPQAMGDLP